MKIYFNIYTSNLSQSQMKIYFNLYAVRRDHGHLKKNNKKQRINATAAPAAMKGSARARSVIAAPVKAEERLLKVCASVAEN